jgi:DNA-binding NarL/FixJ family response regulator
VESGKIKIILVDDHYIVRNGIRALFDDVDEIEVIGEASNGVEAIAKVKELSPDIAILDISMPQMNGLDAADIIHKQFPNTKTLIMSMHDNKDYILRSLEVGADGYLLKDSSKEEIIKAIKTVSEGEKYYSGSVSGILVSGYMNVVANPSGTDFEKKKSGISKQEKSILAHLVQGRNSREIAEELTLSVRTVDNHRARMMKKLGVKNAVELVKMALEDKLLED